MDETIWTLEFLLEKYAAARGAQAARLEDLVNAGYLAYLPKDPSGVPYQYDAGSGKVSLSPESKVHYFNLDYGYRATFRENLARLYESTHR